MPHQPTVYLASFKGTNTGLYGVLNRFVRWATCGAYSHTEVCVGHPFDGPVLCVSSVGRDGGVRGKLMRLNPAVFDLEPLPGVTPADVHAFLSAHDGQGYDLLGTILTVLPFVGREHPVKWICSEVAAHLMRLPDAWRFHPVGLHCVAQGMAARQASNGTDTPTQTQTNNNT
jgi:hypothetical protein